MSIMLLQTELQGNFVIHPDHFGDERGYFSPFFVKKNVAPLGFGEIVQENRSLSSKGVVRGLHFQKGETAQAKIVEVLSGKAIDVIVDMRPESKTYGQWVACLLTPPNYSEAEAEREPFGFGEHEYFHRGNTWTSFLVPRGFAHGFVALEDNTVFQYMVDNDYRPDKEDGILWNDPMLKIPWQKWFDYYDITHPILSDKDVDRHTLFEWGQEQKRQKAKGVE